MATKQDLRLQTEYNEALKLSQSVTAAITKDLDEQIDKRTVLGKKVKDYLNDLRSSVNDLQTSEDVQNKIVENEKEIEKITKSYFGANKKVGEEKIKALQTVNRSLAIEGQRLELTEKVSDAANDMVDSLTSGYDSMTSGLSDIPLFGGMLSKAASVGGDAIKNKLGNAAKGFVTNFRGGLNKGMSSMGALRAAAPALGKSLVAALSSPLVIIGLVVAAIGLAIKRFSELDAAALKFRESTGLLVSQTGSLLNNIQTISKDFSSLGVSAEDVASAAADFTNEFGGIEQPSKDVLSSMVTLNKNFGVGTQEASKLNKVFQNIGGLSAKQSQYLIGQAVQMAKIANVAPGQVIKDMAESSEYAYRYFQGSPDELAKAAVQAAKLGTSIKEAGKVADGLLDFESSITKELEASAILGTNINLSQARGLAAQGKVLEAQQAVNDEVAKLGDLTKLNKWQQDALSEATGMEFESLVNQQRIRERFGKLNEEDLAAATALVDAGKDITKLTTDDLKAQTEKMKAQQDMQSQMDKLSNSTSALGTGFMDMLAPVASFLIPAFTDLADLLGSVLLPTFKVLGGSLKIAFGVLSAIWNILMAILKPIFAIAGAIIDLIATPLAALGDSLQPLFDKFAELKDVAMYSMGPVLDLFKSFSSWIYDGIATPIGWVVDFLLEGFNMFFSLIKGIADIVQIGVVDPIKSIASSVQSFFGFGGEDSSPTPSVNDGVMQDGKVISTSPEDFLIATKNPGSLAESMSGMPSISMEGVIQELRLLKEAFLSNKDVYMDTVKVTSVVRKTTERATDNKFGTLQA